MDTREEQRIAVLERLAQGQLTAGAAAEMLALSVRQVRRLVAAYRAAGAGAVRHGNRARQPASAIPATVRQQVITLAQTTYRGCNHQHLSELLAEREGLQLSRSTVRRILLAAGLHSPRQPAPPPHRQRRAR